MREEIDRFGLLEQRGGRVALTVLGRAWAHRRALQHGYDAPAGDVFADADPSLLGMLNALPADDAADELVRWCERGSAPDGGEVVRGLLAAGELFADAEVAVSAVSSLSNRGAAALPVLQAIADAHPDRAVSQDARRCLFRLRTAAVTPTWPTAGRRSRQPSPC